MNYQNRLVIVRNQTGNLRLDQIWIGARNAEEVLEQISPRKVLTYIQMY